MAMLAHTMKGSARGIGAWRVARAAEALELAGGTDEIGGALDAPCRGDRRGPRRDRGSAAGELTPS